MNALVRTLMVGLLALPLLASASSAIDVPEGNYAVLRFGQPVSKAVLPPDAPVEGKPYFMSGNHVLLLRFKPSKTPVEAVIELADGTTRVLTLQPRKGAPTEVQVDGTAPVVVHKAPAVAPAVGSRDPNAYAVNVLAALVAGGAVDGWESVDPSSHPILVYDRLRAVPARMWQGPEGDQVVDYRLISVNKAVSLLDPSQFYREGVAAALLIDNRVMPGHDGELLMVEKVAVPDGPRHADLQTSEPEPPVVPGVQMMPSAGSYDGNGQSPNALPPSAPGMDGGFAEAGQQQNGVSADSPAGSSPPALAIPPEGQPASGAASTPSATPAVLPPKSTISNPYADTPPPAIPQSRMPPPINASALPSGVSGAINQANSQAAKEAGAAAQQTLPGGSGAPAGNGSAN